MGRGYSATYSRLEGESVGLEYSMQDPNALRVGKEEKNPERILREKEERQKSNRTTAEKTFSLLNIGQFGALAVLVLLICLPMLQKWTSTWGNRDATNRNDIYSFYYNDTYTIDLPDGTTKQIEWYNPEAENESVYMDEVENYETLEDVYTGEVGGTSINGLVDALGTLNTALDVGYKMFDKISNYVGVIQRVDDYYNWSIPKLWNKLKNLVTDLGS